MSPKITSLCILAGVLVAGGAWAQGAVAVSGGLPAIASYYAIGSCLDVANANVIMHAACNAGRGAQAWRFVSGSYGQISLGNQTCLTSGLASGQPLTAQMCSNGRNQRWGFQGDGSLRNEINLCVTVEGGNRASGARIVAANCNASMTQKWYMATSGGKATFRISSTTFVVPTGKALITSSGESAQNIVAGGAGNIVAGGAGNIVAGGAGNIVAGGAGNIVAGGAGNIIAASIVAGGAGNIVAGGAGNIVAGGAGNLIANDGASMRVIAASSYR